MKNHTPYTMKKRYYSKDRKKVIQYNEIKIYMIRIL